MNVRVEAKPMTVASAMTEPVLIATVAIDNASKIVITDNAGLSLTVPTISGHSISAINPEFMKVGALV